MIARIAAWEADPPEGECSEGECWSYHQQWLGALEDVLAGDGTVSSDEIVVRANALANRPAGHDHSHPH